jgi:hypothetical protein
MKLKFRLLILPIIILALAGCGKDEDDDVPATVAPYHSLDMTAYDGNVTQLQRHKVGKGIPIVIMGDGFVDKDIKEGKYRKATTLTLDALFSIYPMTVLRDYFDVYEVTAVSYNDYSDQGSSFIRTAFTVRIADNSSPNVVTSNIKRGDENKMVEYAKKAIDGNRIDDATIIMLVNDDCMAGLCTYLSGLETYTDVPTGCAVAHVTLMGILQSYSYDISRTGFARTLLHEFGHAFAKLADEYTREGNDWIGDSWIADINHYQLCGFDSNVSVSGDVTKSYWADFAADSRYDFEGLGCYEGAMYYSKGVYRATFANIMNCNGDYFNVAHRSMIYKRCMKIAFGDSWEYDYEGFVNFDLEGAKAWKAAHSDVVYSKSKALRNKLFCR